MGNEQEKIKKEAVNEFVSYIGPQLNKLQDMKERLKETRAFLRGLSVGFDKVSYHFLDYDAKLKEVESAITDLDNTIETETFDPEEIDLSNVDSIDDLAPVEEKDNEPDKADCGGP